MKKFSKLNESYNTNIANKVKRNWSYQITDGDHAGEVIWSHRSVAVCSVVLANINNQLCILANKRGEGAADFQGFWNMPCGYVEYNTTTEEAASLEVFEETTIDIPSDYFKMFNINSKPTENRQNITIRYICDLRENNDVDLTINKSKMNINGGEENEVDDIKWIPIEEVNKYKWAFEHDKLIDEVLKFLKVV